MLVHDLDVRIINAATGELPPRTHLLVPASQVDVAPDLALALAILILWPIDPTRDWQPRDVPTGRPRKSSEPPTPRPENVVPLRG